MKETIDDYDLLLHGEHNNNLDYRFYRIYKVIKNDIKYTAIEVVIDMKEGFSGEMIVHMNYIGEKRNRALNLYHSHIRNKKLIDFKKIQ